MNKNLIVLCMVVFLSSFVFAAHGNPNTYMSQDQNMVQKMEQHQNQFQNKYNFSCEGECTYGINEQEQVTLQIRERKMFLLWEVVSESNLIINEDGEVTDLARNIWAILYGVPLDI